jgi:hypothetical protein
LFFLYRDIRFIDSSGKTTIGEYFVDLPPESFYKGTFQLRYAHSIFSRLILKVPISLKRGTQILAFFCSLYLKLPIIFRIGKVFPLFEPKPLLKGPLFNYVSPNYFPQVPDSSSKIISHAGMNSQKYLDLNLIYG